MNWIYTVFEVFLLHTPLKKKKKRKNTTPQDTLNEDLTLIVIFQRKQILNEFMITLILNFAAGLTLLIHAASRVWCPNFFFYNVANCLTFELTLLLAVVLNVKRSLPITFILVLFSALLMLAAIWWGLFSAVP